VNQRWAAIGDFQGRGNAYYGNHYGGITSGASQVTDEHVSLFEEEG